MLFRFIAFIFLVLFFHSCRDSGQQVAVPFRDSLTVPQIVHPVYEEYGMFVETPDAQPAPVYMPEVYQRCDQCPGIPNYGKDIKIQ